MEGVNLHLLCDRCIFLCDVHLSFALPNFEQLRLNTSPPGRVSSNFSFSCLPNRKRLINPMPRAVKELGKKVPPPR
jgi:hypothetical protein